MLHIVDHSVSMANKLAAWNERRLARDLYDIWFFLQMNITPDLKILSARLKTPRYSPLLKTRERFAGSNIEDFYEFLRSRVGLLSDQEIEQQLSDYLLAEDLAGLVPLLRAALVKLRATDHQVFG